MLNPYVSRGMYQPDMQLAAPLRMLAYFLGLWRHRENKVLGTEEVRFSHATAKHLILSLISGSGFIFSRLLLLEQFNVMQAGH